MRRLFGCPDIVSLTEKFLMARNFFRIFTENNPVMGYSKTFFIPEAKGLMVISSNFLFFWNICILFEEKMTQTLKLHISEYLSEALCYSKCSKNNVLINSRVARMFRVGDKHFGGKFTDTKLKWTQKLCQNTDWIPYVQKFRNTNKFGHYMAYWICFSF